MISKSLSLLLIIIYPLLCINDALSKQIDQNFSLNVFTSIETAIVHDSNSAKKSNSLELLRLFEKFSDDPMFFELVHSMIYTKSKMKFIPFNLNFQAFIDYTIAHPKNFKLGAHFELDHSISPNDTSLKLFNPYNKFPGTAYTFIESENLGRFEMGYADSVSSTIIARTRDIAVGAQGVEGNWTQYTHLWKNDESYMLKYTENTKFWVKQSLFSNYIDFKPPVLNYYSPSANGLRLGFTYSPGNNSHKQFILNEDEELLDTLYFKSIFAVAAEYKHRRGRISIAMETTDATNKENIHLRQYGTSIGTDFRFENFQIALSTGFIIFPDLIQKHSAEYIAAGITYIEEVRKIGVSGFFSSSDGNELKAISVDFENKLSANLIMNLLLRETNEKSSTHDYLNCCSYYIQIVGFQTKKVPSELNHEIQYNGGYALVLGLKALF